MLKSNQNVKAADVNFSDVTSQQLDEFVQIVIIRRQDRNFYFIMKSEIESWSKCGINKSNNDTGFMEGQFENQNLGMASLTQGIFIIRKPDRIEENGLGDDDLKCER